MKRLKTVSVIACLLCVGLSIVRAEEDKAGASTSSAKASKKVSRENATKEDIINYIKMALEHESEVVGSMPGLEQEEGPDKNIFYTYKGRRLDEHDKETLQKLYSSIQNEAARVRTERLNKQLESIRQAQQAAMAAQQALRVPAQPQAVGPIQPPRIPQPPPSPPSIPQPPPQPPRTDRR